MKYMRFFVLALTIAFSGGAFADEASEVASEKMLEALDMPKVLDGAIEVALDGQIASKPEMAPYKGVMRQFFAKYMSYSALKPQLVAIYSSEFTANELAEATEFTQLPLAKNS